MDGIKINRSQSSTGFDLAVEDISKDKAQKCYGNSFYPCIDQRIYKSHRNFCTAENRHDIVKSYKFQIRCSGRTPVCKCIIISNCDGTIKKIKNTTAGISARYSGYIFFRFIISSLNSFRFEVLPPNLKPSLKRMFIYWAKDSSVATLSSSISFTHSSTLMSPFIS